MAGAELLTELSQNFVYADVEGNIGWHVTGAVPKRAQGNGQFPVPGDSGEYEWQGCVPFHELPSAYNPSEAYIVTANNKIVPDNYPYTISNSWSSPVRYQRIKQLIEEKPKLSAEDFAHIQSDTYNAAAGNLIQALRDVRSSDPRVRAAIDQLQQWDLKVTSDSAAASLYEVTLVKLGENIFGDELGDLYKDFSGLFADFYSALDDILDKPDARWWDDIRTAQKETRGDILERSIRMALQELDAYFGADPQRWHWGMLHRAHFIHPLGRVQPLDRLYNFSVDYKGDSATVNAGHFQYNDSYSVSGLSSLRMIVDLADLDRSRMVITTGQSANVLSRHYRDQNELWTAGQYHPMFFREDLVEQNAEGTLVLQPLH